MFSPPSCPRPAGHSRFSQGGREKAGASFPASACSLIVTQPVFLQRAGRTLGLGQRLHCACVQEATLGCDAAAEPMPCSAGSRVLEAPAVPALTLQLLDLGEVGLGWGGTRLQGGVAGQG